MKSIALIHTVQSVATAFGNTLQEYLDEEVKVHNLWDDFLANNPNEVGEFTIENRNRLFNDIKTAELTGADVIAVTCSTLTPIVKMIRPFVKVPLIAIDDAMAKKAVTFGSNIMILATAESTLQPTQDKLEEEAGLLGIQLNIQSMAVMEAFKALKDVDMERHDTILKETAKLLAGYDCIVLAQASMAHLEDKISRITGCTVLSSPKLCMQQIQETLKTV